MLMAHQPLTGTVLAGMIDHTLLRPDSTPAEIERLCGEAKQYGFASVCVNSSYVRFCAKLLAGSPVRVCVTVGFPLGAMSTSAKVYEAEGAIDDGAQEVDMVMNIGMLKSGNRTMVEEDIHSVVQAAHRRKALVKVILETGLLTDEEKILACEIAKSAGADFVKTSTGFGHGGATIADVALMRKTVGPSLGVKASGGIRTREEAIALIRAGANRLGASAGVRIVGEKS
jgi:deoxyribose-phosphate aldolase